MVPRSRVDTLIFDYDGVIADTEPMHWRIWAEILEPLGISFTWDQYCEFGRGVKEAGMLAKLLPLQTPWALSELEEQGAQRRRIMLDMWVEQPPIAEATLEMLLSLRDYRLALVTSSAQCDVEPVLRSAGIYRCFDAMVFGGDVERHKPAPDPYLLAKHLLGSGTGLVFEDSHAGIASAQQAGLTVIPIADPGQLSATVYRELERAQSESGVGVSR
jgi:beta-phosphoglucomutase